MEGVWTSEQARRLAALGCDTAQGWYFATAVPGDRVTAVLRDNLTPRFPSRERELLQGAEALTSSPP